MGGHGHDSHGHHHAHTNPNAIPEPDTQMPHKIREIELIKHYPNLFHVSPFDIGKDVEVLGGNKFLASTGLGAAFGYWYFSAKNRHTPATFYTHIFLLTSRLVLGAFVGGYVGYLRFGDRQRLHNAYVAERLRRRYPDCMTLKVTDLYRFKGVKSSEEYYRWT